MQFLSRRVGNSACASDYYQDRSYFVFIVLSVLMRGVSPDSPVLRMSFFEVCRAGRVDVLK